MSKGLISVIVPAFNEELCIEELARRLTLVFVDNPKYDFETLIVENGSTDRTWDLLKTIHVQDPRFKVIRLARNFRMDGGITAGLNFAKGDAVVFMTADLQDPPELITKFIKKWEEGFDNVFTIVSKRIGVSVIRKLNSQIFYFLANRRRLSGAFRACGTSRCSWVLVK
jgi:dolichol-phosphate mannosyltransferase